MGLSEAIRLGFSHYANASGRASRSTFWWWLLYANVAVTVPMLMWFLYANIPAAIPILMDFAPPTEPGHGTVLATRLLLLALLLPTGTLIVRRLHDMNRSGHRLLIELVPVLGTVALLVLAAMPGTPGPNRFGVASDFPRRVPAAGSTATLGLAGRVRGLVGA